MSLMIDDSAAVLHGRPETAQDAPSAVQGTQPATKRALPSRTCPECGLAFEYDPMSAQRTKIFCSDAHRVANTNRWTVRGRQALIAIAAARQTRDGSRGKHKGAGRKAASLARGLMQRWQEEDRAAGRMDAAELFELRDRLGFNDNLI